MFNFGPEEFVMSNGKKVVIKSWDASQPAQLEEVMSQFAKERAYDIQKEEAHLLVEEMETRAKAVINPPMFLGVHDEGKMIAYMTIRRPLLDRPWEKHIGILGLVLLQDYWGLGLGTKLLEIAERLSKQLNITRLESKVRVKNQRASSLFIRSKYQIEGKRSKAAYINGVYEDEYYLAKILET